MTKYHSFLYIRRLPKAIVIHLSIINNCSIRKLIRFVFFKGLNGQSDNPYTLLLRAKAFLGILVLNSSTNSTTANSLYLIVNKSKI